MVEGGNHSIERNPDIALKPADANNDSTIVLKLGGSVLTSQRHVAQAVSEIYRYLREGSRVLAVVSAFGGVTDALARRAGVGAASMHAPYLLGTGECAAAALLALALEKVGIDAHICLPHELEMIAEGPPTAASLVGVSEQKLRMNLNAHECVIVPGFFADNHDGRRVLLGRGGTDLSAVYLGAALPGARIRLIKDVDGVYEADPKKTLDPKRYCCVSYDEALRCASPLIQPKTIEFARQENVHVEIAGLQSAYETCLCTETILGSNRSDCLPLRIAMLGCGVVGTAVINRLLMERHRLKVVRVLINDPDKQRPYAPGVSFVHTLDDSLLDNIDIFVDVGSAEAPSAVLIKWAIEKGIPVVSANKLALASNLAIYKKLAGERQVNFQFSAAAGGAAPLVETAIRARAAGTPVCLEGILTSTVNVILERIAAGMQLDQAIKFAVAEGSAEADPNADLEGRDAAAKLVLLADAAFGKTIFLEDVVRERLTNSLPLPSDGKCLKQLSRVELLSDGTICAEVSLVELQFSDYLAGAVAEENRIKIKFSDGSEWRCRGKGAGAVPTAEAVYADLCDVERWVATTASMLDVSAVFDPNTS